MFGLEKNKLIVPCGKGYSTKKYRGMKKKKPACGEFWGRIIYKTLHYDLIDSKISLNSTLVG